LPNPEKNNFIGYSTVVPDTNYDFKKVTYTVTMTATIASNKVTFSVDFKASIENEQVCYLAVFPEGKTTFIQSDFLNCKTYCGSTEGYKKSQTIKITGDAPSDSSKYKASFICKQNVFIANIFSPADSSAPISVPKPAAVVSSSTKAPTPAVSSSTSAAPVNTQVSVQISSSSSVIIYCTGETDYEIATIKSFPDCCASQTESETDSTMCQSQTLLIGFFMIAFILLVLS
jgi:hypothetical protein